MACFHHSCFDKGVWRCLLADVVIGNTPLFFSARGIVVNKMRKEEVYDMENVTTLMTGAATIAGSMATIASAAVKLAGLARRKSKNSSATKLSNKSVGGRKDCGGKNYDKYKVVGLGGGFNKRRLVLAVVHCYVKNHPNSTINDLKNTFQDEWQNTYIIRNPKDFEHGREKEMRHNFFTREDELLRLANGEIAMVCCQWGSDNIGKFIKGAGTLGFKIEVEKHSS